MMSAFTIFSKRLPSIHSSTAKKPPAAAAQRHKAGATYAEPGMKASPLASTSLSGTLYMLAASIAEPKKSEAARATKRRHARAGLATSHAHAVTIALHARPTTIAARRKRLFIRSETNGRKEKTAEIGCSTK